jgi:sugar/nucleoside kinase (ribokinase family)
MTRAFDACVIGHVVRDLNVIGGVERPPAPGGAAYYAGMVHLRLGLRTLVVTKVAPADEPLLLDGLRAHGAEVINLPTATAVSTVFRNIDAPDRPAGRRQRVDAVADPIRPGELPEVTARVWQLGPLTQGDLGPGLAAACLGRGGLVGVDVQGLTRAVVDGEVRPRRPEPERGAASVRGVHVLKADEAEILAFTGGADVAAAAEGARQRFGVRGEVLITRADRGSIIFGPGGRLAIKALPPRREVDATGCGDTYFAAYLARRIEYDDPRECGEFAATIAGMKIEGFGPFRGTRDDVAARRAAGIARSV